MSSHLGEFEQLILFALLRLGERAYGVSVRQEIEERTGRPVTSGAVYTTLGRLEARGFVTSRIGETAPQRGGRRRKYYRVEPAGAAALQRTYVNVRDMSRGLTGRLAALAAASDSHSED